MKKYLLFFFLFLIFISSFFYLYKNDFKIFKERESKEIIKYDGNFKDKKEDDVSFNNSITSGVIADIEGNFIYISSHLDGNEQRKILLDNNTKYTIFDVDPDYKVISKKEVDKEDIKINDSVVVVPKYSSEEGELDFGRAEEVKIILVKNE